MAAPIAFAWLLLTRLCTAGCSSLVCKAVSKTARWVEHHTPLGKFTDALTKPLPAPAVRRFQLAMSGSVPLPLPDLDGPPGRIGRSLEQPDEFPKLTSV